MALNPSSTGSTIEFQDSPCFNFTSEGSGTKGDPLIIGLGINSDGSIKCDENGLVACINITNGTDGTDGTNGGNGNDGTNGTDGSDGTVTISTDPADCLITTLSGEGSVADPLTLSGEIRLSQNPDNTLICTTGGLLSLVELNVTSLSPCFVSEVTGAGTPDNPFEIENELLIKPCADNLICCNNDGLYAGIEYNFGSGNCVEFDIIGFGTVDDPLCFYTDIKLSSLDENNIKCAQDGLYVPTYQLLSQGAPCIDIDVSGSGEYCDPWVLKPEIIISGAEDNKVKCTNKGLYVGADHIVGGLTECIKVSTSGLGTSENPHIVSAELTIKPHPDNNITCTAEGLFVEDRTNLIFKDTGLVTWEVTGAGTPSDPKVICPTIKVAPPTGGEEGEPCGSGLLFQCGNGLDVRPTPITVPGTCCGTGAWIEISGSGDLTDPYEICVGTQLDGSDCNLLNITDEGLSLTCEDICCCLEAVFADEPAFSFFAGKAFFEPSTDDCNLLTVGCDGKPYVGPVGIDNSDIHGVVLDLCCPDNTLSAKIHIDGTYPDNALSINNGGLYVQSIKPKSTKSVSVELDKDNAVCANVNLSQGACNGISETLDGLFVDGRNWSNFELGLGGTIVPNCIYDEAAFVSHDNITVKSLTWYLQGAPSGSNLTAQVLVNGMPAYTLDIASGTSNNGSGVIALGEGFDVPAGAAVMLNVLSSGIETPAENLTLNFKYCWCSENQ